MPLPFLRLRPVRPPLILALFLLLLAPTAARAEGNIVFSQIRVAEGWLELDFELTGGFSPKVIETLDGGLPATLIFEVELWRARASWFDHLEETRYLTYRIEFDLWEKVYRAGAPGREPRTYPDLASLTADLLRRERLRILPVRRLRRREPHYFSVRAEVRPVELRQIREIEAWLEGKIPVEGEQEGDGTFLGAVPERLFGFAASLAGFGEDRIEARSITFRPEALE
ncbi:MAG: DUF4390 domain-containing protein [Candidatus Eisenbacteria bacterium]|nr:DUF4390 domain-containing protein [Candidatus Eisenbacteria bacterium]